MLVQCGNLELTVAPSAQAEFEQYRNWFTSYQQLLAARPQPLLAPEHAPLSPVAMRLECEQPQGQFSLTWPHPKGDRKLIVCHQQLLRQLRSSVRQTGALFQAIGRRTRRVIDATSGWGGDAMLLAGNGLHVHCYERHPLFAMMQHNSYLVARGDLPDAAIGSLPVLTFGDAVDAFAEVSGVDCVYLDPMFPPKRKQSAQSNKYMQVAQVLDGTGDSLQRLWEGVERSAVRRWVVKRPHYIAPNFLTTGMRAPSETFKAKLVHYDLYLR